MKKMLIPFDLISIDTFSAYIYSNKIESLCGVEFDAMLGEQ